MSGPLRVSLKRFFESPWSTQYGLSEGRPVTKTSDLLRRGPEEGERVNRRWLKVSDPQSQGTFSHPRLLFRLPPSVAGPSVIPSLSEVEDAGPTGFLVC